ncbi:MAG: Gfo/Idh/MocA family oxidoreductase [bacterium]|nr:Gfo/Idh/MocA family oxidoreductase [bacterium]
MTVGNTRLARRRFFKIAGLAAAPWFVPACATGRKGPAPSERIAVGVIGLGSRGLAVLGEFIREPDTQIVALCDVDPIHYRDRKWGQGTPCGLEPAAGMVKRYYESNQPQSGSAAPATYTDYRELCARDDIDVVVVATPDHWHALCTLEALRRGKDVYCEKPITHLFHEGQAVYKEAAKRKAIFQTGSQQRSDARFRRAVELVLNGHVGEVRRVEVGLPNGYAGPMGDTAVTDPPERLDYEFWCGPSSRLPYMRARHHRFWRGHTAYGGGVLMDFIGHHNDIAHWGLGMDKGGPTRVEAVNWRFPDTEVYNTPQDYEIRCEYAKGITSTIGNKNPTGVKWIGEDGWVYVNRGELKASNACWADKDYDPGPVKAYASPRHVRNLLDCVRSRKPCVAPPETAHRSITPGHLGYVSHRLGRALTWHPAKERVIGDDEADRLLRTVDYRGSWSLEA